MLYVPLSLIRHLHNLSLAMGSPTKVVSVPQNSASWCRVFFSRSKGESWRSLQAGGKRFGRAHGDMTVHFAAVEKDPGGRPSDRGSVPRGGLMNPRKGTIARLWQRSDLCSIAVALRRISWNGTASPFRRLPFQVQALPEVRG